MPTPYHTIDFPLKKGLPSIPFQFLPYGTRTLKVKVSNPEGLKGNLILRSKHLPDDFGDDSFLTHEEGGTDFSLSWGGGHEKGACVLGKDMEKQIGPKKVRIPFEECTELPTEKSGYIYLNLTHTTGKFDKGRKLILAVQPEEQKKNKPLRQLEIDLQPPDVSDPVRLEKLEKKLYTFRGTQVPSYLNRWWSPVEVTYAELPHPMPKLQLRMKRNDLLISMATEEGQSPDDYKVIAKLGDSIKFQDIGESRYFDAELYHMTGQFFVLRLWFFWLWKTGIDTWGNEIPDAERFDLIIDTNTNRVRYAATDTHWTEAWAEAPADEPVEAQIGLFSGEVLAHQTRSRRKRRDKYLDWMLGHRPGHDEREEPHIPSQVILRILEEGSIPAEDLGPGLEAHVPYFINALSPDGENFVSTDVRLG